MPFHLLELKKKAASPVHLFLDALHRVEERVHIRSGSENLHLREAALPSTNCPQHIKLAAAAHNILKSLRDLTSRQLEAFESGDRERFMKFDRELELMLGEKERTIGRLRQHDEEHGCQL